MAMAEAVCKMEEDPVSSYWITVQFYRHFDKFKDSLVTLVSLCDFVQITSIFTSN